MINLDGSTQVYGIFGYPVKHSKSPLFQTAAFRHLGINAVYVPFCVKPENLQQAISSIKVLGIKGVNITIPFKEDAVKYMDEVSEEVKVIGALNTVKNIDGYLVGYNTDCYGFVEGLKQIEPDIQGKTAVIIGAGGASRAVVYGLLKENICKIYIANRTVERAQAIVQDFKKYYRVVDEIIQPLKLDEITKYLEKAQIVINTTSVGLNDQDSPIFDYEMLQPHQCVVDIIYKKTALLKKAEEKGCRFQDGYPMLIYQGAKSFEIWTGQVAPVDIMKKALSL